MKNTNIQVQGVGFILTITGLLKVLWNKLFPQLFGWKRITYWQSVMLYLICKALFDFRYNIKDSFNFGNNTINGEKAGKKSSGKPAKPAEEVVEEQGHDGKFDCDNEINETVEVKIEAVDKKKEDEVKAE